MSDGTLETATKFINSPPGVLVGGGVLFGLVTKFFKEIEERLNDDTKLEIAIWLLGANAAKLVNRWPAGFKTMFKVVFGPKLLSRGCFLRCVAIATICSALLYLYLNRLEPQGLNSRTLILAYAVAWPFVVFSEFLCVLQSYFWIGVVEEGSAEHTGLLKLTAAALFVNLMIADVLSIAPVMLLIRLLPTSALRSALDSPLSLAFFITAIIPSLWLWLYVTSGFVLKSARRLDIGFDWFNRRFDIEKKPLQSLGLVAGTILACAYWVALLFGRMMHLI